MSRRLALAVMALALAVGGCLPAPQAESGIPRLPKAGTPGTSLPDLQLTPVPSATIGPPGGLVQLIPRDFPPPFSYGPVYDPPTPIPPPADPHRFPPDAVNVLLLGSDRRPDATSFRTDTLVVVSLHPSDRGAAVISIPRDLYIYLPGFNMQRINAAMPLGESYGYPGGGLGMLMDAIHYNLGIPIHYYAQVEMDGFRRIVDQLDGIYVHVACSYTDWRLRSPDLNPEVEDNWRLFTVPTGVVHMDGDYALWYARSRARSSDFDRARRQQEVLRALHRQGLRLGVIPQIPDLYGELVSAVNTDLSLEALVNLAPLAARIDPARVRSRFIGRDQVRSWRTPTGGAVLLPNAEAIDLLLDDALSFEQVDPVAPDPGPLVEIVNGSNRGDWGTLAEERLTYAGYRTRLLRSGADDSASSYLIDYGLASAAERNDLLSAVRLGASRVQQLSGGAGAAFRFVVGDDFDPCFDPTRNQ